MENIDYEKWIDAGLKVTPFLILLVFWKKVMSSWAWIRDGISKKEFVALCFLGRLVYMTYVDANRTHEWSYFSDLDKSVTFIYIAVGLGINEILEAIYTIKGVKRNETPTESRQ